LNVHTSYSSTTSKFILTSKKFILTSKIICNIVNCSIKINYITSKKLSKLRTKLRGREGPGHRGEGGAGAQGRGREAQGRGREAQGRGRDLTDGGARR
jgi:hypothetical protein